MGQPNPTQQRHFITPSLLTPQFPVPIVFVDSSPVPSPTHRPQSAAAGDDASECGMGEVQESPPPPWLDLPSELLGLVFLRLPKRADRAFFHAVCRSWCSAARRCRLPPPSPVPWLLLPDGSATSFPRGETFQLLPDGMRYHRSCGEWVLLSRNDGSCLLMNHVTKATMPLPSLSSQSYYQEPEMRGTYLDNKDKQLSVTSLVVCSTRLIAAIVTAGTINRVALCRPGSSAWSVRVDEVDSDRWFSDMVFLQGKIYALDINVVKPDLIAIDIVDGYDSEPRVSRIERLIEGVPFPCLDEFLCMPYLLESHGTLLMVYEKHSYKSLVVNSLMFLNTLMCFSEFAVFEANFEQHLWSAVRTLGNDQALFLGQGCSRVVHVSPYDLSRDCIFFLDNFSGCRRTTTSCKLYDMKDEKIYSPLPMVSCKSGKVHPIWIFSQGETDKGANSRGGGM